MHKALAKNTLFFAGLLLLANAGVLRAVEVSSEEWKTKMKLIDDLQKSVEELKSNKQVRGASYPIDASAVDTALDSKYGPNANVTSKTAKITIGGLLQVWYVNYDKDTRGLFDDPAVSGIRDTNEANDNNTFRIRRAQMRITADVNEQIMAYMMIDPAAECQGFPTLPANWGNYKTFNNLSPEFIAANKLPGVSSKILALQNNGVFGATTPQLLQDAFINWHNCIPYHDFQIGEFRPWIGEEDIRNDGNLDFIERPMVTFQGTGRDLGASVHGSFWGKDCYDRDGRFQYWAGIFDGAASYFQVSQALNRPDNNQSKDYNFRMLVRPIWDECRGKLELGGSFIGGHHGQSSGHSLGYYDPLVTGEPQWGIDRPGVWASHYNGWFSYYAPQMFSGLWMRGECTWLKDANNPLSNIDFTGSGSSANAFLQDFGRPTSVQGVTGTIAYTFADSCWAQDGNGMPCWLKPVEVLARYDQFQNVMTADESDPTTKVNRFYTKCVTAGVNYYIKGHNAKVQANYNWVLPPGNQQNATRTFHKVDMDNFAFNFQVAF